MKTLKIALASFFVGMLLSVAPIVTYACEAAIYVQDTPDCHYYHRYEFAGGSCNADGSVCSCAYLQTSSVHREDVCVDGGGYATDEGLIY